MPKAAHTLTTGCVVAPSRRQLGGSILAAACGAAFAGAVVLPNPSEAFPAEGIREMRMPLQPSPDAHLLTLCTEAMRLDLAADAPGVGGGECGDLIAQWFVVAEEIAATPARTPAGIRAKAGIVRHLMTPSSRLPDGGEMKWDEGPVFGPLTWSLVNDLAAVA